MGLTVSTLTPAIEKAKNVATESYVDSTVSTASAALETAYIAYNNTVKQALIDGEISDAETTAIAAAEEKVNAAKTLLNASIVTAQTTANTAISNAAAANTLLADIASDSKLTPDEKTATQKELDIIVSEYSKNTAQASTYGVSSSTYTAVYNSLSNYITPLLSSLSTTSAIVGTTFRTNFKNYYDARTDLLNAIATKISVNADAAASTALSNANAYTNSAISGSGFVLPSGVAAAVNSNTTTINGSKITTGSIAAAQIQANSISADKLIAGTNSSTVWTGGGLISQNFNGNPYGNIGTPSTGFRLSSGAAGTSTDPNIYGAYIQGSSVEVNSFKVRAEGYASNFGRLNLVSGSTAIVGRGYSTGFDARRVCSDSVSNIKLDCWARATGNWISAVLEYESNSNGSWILVADRGMSMYGYSEYAYLNFAEFFNPSLVPTTGYVHFRIRLTSGNSGSTSGVVVTLSNG